MTFLRNTLLSTTLLISIISGPGRAASPDVHAVFAVTANGWSIGELNASYTQTGNAYDVTLKGGAQGLFGFLLQATYDGHSSGHLNADGQPITDIFTATSHRIFKSRRQRVDFLNNRPVAVSIEPSRDMTELSDPALVTDDRVDPLTYLGQFLQDRTSGCPAPADLYDGRRLTRVSFNLVIGPADAIICDGEYKIVKGPDHSIRKGYRSFGVRLEYKMGDASAAHLDRVDFSSGGNTLVLQRGTE